MKLRYWVIAGFAVWAILGSPTRDLAGLFWPDRPAPWEAVDAFYYPDRHDLTVHRSAHNVAGIAGCRSWVNMAASANSDPSVSRGDYECGVGKIEELGGGVTVYRLSVR